MGYAGLKLDDVVEKCPTVTPANIRRTVGARRDTPFAELHEIAHACGVPWSWFELGKWDTDDEAAPETPELRFGQGSLEHRMVVVETYLAELAKQLAIQGIATDKLLRSDTQSRATPIAPHAARQ